MQIETNVEYVAEDAFTWINYEINEIWRSIGRFRNCSPTSDYGKIPGFYERVSRESFLTGAAYTYCGGMCLIAALEYPGSRFEFHVELFNEVLGKLFADSNNSSSTGVSSWVRTSREAISKLAIDLADCLADSDFAEGGSEDRNAKIGYFTMGYVAWVVACKTEGIAYGRSLDLWSDTVGHLALVSSGRRIYDSVLSWWLIEHASIEGPLTKFRKPHEEMGLTLVGMIRKDGEIREKRRKLLGF